ncbi:MAG: lipoate--protein ligase family protein [Bacilli bacterium]
MHIVGPFFYADPLEAFAYDEAFAQTENEFPFIHLWQADGWLALGFADTRWTESNQPPSTLRPFVRPAGGRAVALTKDILNISMILPKDEEEPFSKAVLLVKELFPEVKSHLQVGTITYSMCSGDYDLSVLGKKVGGIAVRHTTHAIIAQVYLQIQGDGQKTAQIVADFYRTYPSLNSQVLPEVHSALYVSVPITFTHAYHPTATQKAIMQRTKQRYAERSATLLKKSDALR